MRRSGSDLVVGLVLAALGVLTLGWLVVDLGDTGAFPTIARAAGAFVWFSFAAVVLVDGATHVALATAACSVGILLGALCVGLLVTPDDFVGTTAKAPDSPGEARVLGIGLSLVVLAGSGWLRWRSRRPGRPGRH